MNPITNPKRPTQPSLRGLIRYLGVTCLTLFLGACATSKTVSSVKPYPLKVCLVTGNDLDSMGDTRVEVYNGQEVRFCCGPCVRKFHANPEKYLAKLRK
ncbi:MAG: hypothetical protein WCK17_08525 [Verrucomicrobiota bacterium]